MSSVAAVLLFFMNVGLKASVNYVQTLNKIVDF
jgi:hypothetical protein